MRLWVVVAALSATVSGCATITRGTSDTWTINTTPSGAAVKTTSGFECDATPCSFKMPRKSDFDVTVTKAGYKTWRGHVGNHVAGAGGAGFVGNVLIGGVIGAGVDATSGAMLDLVPNPLNVQLEKDEQNVAAAASPSGPGPSDPSPGGR
jgi:hypothetical protein